MEILWSLHCAPSPPPPHSLCALDSIQISVCLNSCTPFSLESEVENRARPIPIYILQVSPEGFVHISSTAGCIHYILLIKTWQNEIFGLLTALSDLWIDKKKRVLVLMYLVKKN